LYLFLFILLGLALRLANIDKLEGLWNDEYVSWFIASTPFFKGFWQEVLKQCHMPLYYLYLKPFAEFDDIILRLTSVLPSLLSIPVMFSVGNFFSKKNGYICAGITTILPFLIYYSQEVRFYSLLFFFSALVLYFALKIIYKDKGWVGFIISSILVLFTHVLGGIYIGLSTCYLLYKKKKFFLEMFLLGFCLALLILPFGLNIIKKIPYSQWWGNFTYTNILFLFSDYLSPILTNHLNAPTKFFYSNSILYSILMFIPTLIGTVFFIKGSQKAKGLLGIFVFTILLTAVLAHSGIIVFITKYTIEILPILILLLSLGVKNKIDYILFIFYVFVLLLSFYTPYYPSKQFRSEGNKLVADVLNCEKLDKIIFTFHEPNRYFRYLKQDVEMRHISRSNRFEYLNNPTKILDNIEREERVAVVFLDGVSFIPEKLIEIAKKQQTPEMFITFSIIRNSLQKEFLKNYTNITLCKNGSWLVLIGEKLK